jgi:outer membrane protein assembly factor BamA
VHKLKHTSLTAILAVSCLFNLQAQKDSLAGKKSQPPTKKDSLQGKIAQPVTLKKLFLKVVNLDSASSKGFKMPDYVRVFLSDNERKLELQKLMGTLYDQSYLTATIDSMLEDSTKLRAFLNLGNPYKWAYLRKGNVEDAALSLSGFRDKIFRGKSFYYKTAAKLMNRILAFYENHGYPFAKIQLDSIVVKHNVISASLKVDKKSVETIDSIVVKGNVKLSQQYLFGYLGLKPGDLYDESKVAEMNTRLKALPFVSVTKPLQVLFFHDKAKILLYLAKKSANQANGIIGILPNSTGQLIITGDINLQLQNAFHRGDELGFHWQHLQPLTENLTINFSYPYLFQTPIGFDENFKLYKQDTTYLQLDNKVGLKYLFIGGNYLEVYYESIETSLLSTSGLQYLTVLPPYTDASTFLYGIEYKVRRLDYIYNPRRGYELLGSAAVGEKTIHENSNINPSVYEGLQLNAIEYRVNLSADCYVPVASRASIKFGLNGGYIQSPNLLLNDLFRIGGFQVLRGFNEQSIYASQYAVGTVELHYLLEQNSFFFVFYDQGLVRETLASDVQFYNDTPAGFGAGMDFQTKAGIFSLAYALGNAIGSPLNFGSGKINFGIVDYF